MGSEKEAVNTAPVVLITRPEGQNSDFALRCENLGMQTCLLPCLQINAHNPDVANGWQQIQQHDIVLFTSANAVHHAHRLIPLPWTGICVHAIGTATARVLSNYRQAVAVQPLAPFNSEAYIRQVSALQPQRLLIVKGVGGRDLILRRLRARGWMVQSMDVYERILPHYPPARINAVFTETPPDIVTVSSNETLDNLWSLCDAYRHLLIHCTLLCNSERCATMARQLGFIQPPLVAAPAGDTGQLACLRQWLKARHHTLN